MAIANIWGITYESGNNAAISKFIKKMVGST